MSALGCVKAQSLVSAKKACLTVRDVLYYRGKLVSPETARMIRDFLFFFFFQAEDGIRDDLVTGVQTCALPILFPISRPRRIRNQLAVNEFLPLLGRQVKQQQFPRILGQRGNKAAVGRPLGRERSEERRVGKECRSRWVR